MKRMSSRTRIRKIESQISDLADYLNAAIKYSSSDPESSLTKCRIVLEKLLVRIYSHELRSQPRRPMIGDMLSDKEFIARVPRRIFARMNSIREMANLGAHGEQVIAEDALRVLTDLLDILEWYLPNYGAVEATNSHIDSLADAQLVEILPQLQRLYPSYLRPDIRSVKLGQIPGSCFIEISTKQQGGNYLYNEIIKREDLGFIADDSDPDRLYFNPNHGLLRNVDRFLKEFDEISIINCLDLFTEQASYEIYDYWQRTGKTPTGK